MNRPNGESGEPQWNGPTAGRPRPVERGTEIRIRRVSRPVPRPGGGLAELLRARPLLTLGAAFAVGLILALRTTK